MIVSAANWWRLLLTRDHLLTSQADVSRQRAELLLAYRQRHVLVASARPSPVLVDNLVDQSLLVAVPAQRYNPAEGTSTVGCAVLLSCLARMHACAPIVYGVFS